MLDLQFKCVLGKESFDSFSNMLQVNKSLTSITFNCRFTDDQLKAIARSLVMNGHRAKIELDFNFIDWQFDLLPPFNQSKATINQSSKRNSKLTSTRESCLT